MESTVLEIFRDISGEKSELEADYLILPPEKGRIGVQRLKWFCKINFLKTGRLDSFNIHPVVQFSLRQWIPPFQNISWPDMVSSWEADLWL